MADFMFRKEKFHNLQGGHCLHCLMSFKTDDIQCQYHPGYIGITSLLNGHYDSSVCWSSSNTSVLHLFFSLLCCLVNDDLAMKVWSCCKKDHEDGLTPQEEHISTGYVHFLSI